MGHQQQTNDPVDAEAIRTFICIEIPASVKGRLEDLQRQLRRIEAKASWVSAANIHLTLKFLGDVPKEKMPLVGAAIREAVNRAPGSHSPFQVTVQGVGCFPSPRNPSVLWVGIEPVTAALQDLRDAIEEALAGVGFPRDAKKFKPHLTIARIRTPRNAQRLVEELLSLSFAAESFMAAEIIVMRSDLSPHGSIYTPQAVIPMPTA